MYDKNFKFSNKAKRLGIILKDEISEDLNFVPFKDIYYRKYLESTYYNQIKNEARENGQLEVCVECGYKGEKITLGHRGGMDWSEFFDILGQEDYGHDIKPQCYSCNLKEKSRRIGEDLTLQNANIALAEEYNNVEKKLSMQKKENRNLISEYQELDLTHFTLKNSKKLSDINSIKIVFGLILLIFLAKTGYWHSNDVIFDSLVIAYNMAEKSISANPLISISAILLLTPLLTFSFWKLNILSDKVLGKILR